MAEDQGGQPKVIPSVDTNQRKQPKERDTTLLAMRMDTTFLAVTYRYDSGTLG